MASAYAAQVNASQETRNSSDARAAAGLADLLGEMRTQIGRAPHRVAVGLGDVRYYSQVARRVGVATAQFGRVYPDLLNDAIYSAAHAAAEREIAAGRAATGRSAEQIAESVRAAAYDLRANGDGRTLASRLQNLAQFAHDQAARAVASHEAGDADELSQSAWEMLDAPGLDNVRYRSLRLLVTEAAAAFRAGQAAAVTQADGSLAPGIATI